MSEAFLVSPGQLLTSDQSFMRYHSLSFFLYHRGHGTFIKGGAIYSALSGTVEKVNRLICVKALKSRYTGDIGDVVVGRIVEVCPFNVNFKRPEQRDGRSTLTLGKTESSRYPPSTCQEALNAGNAKRMNYRCDLSIKRETLFVQKYRHASKMEVSVYTHVV